MSFTLLRKEKPTARKDHSCVWCAETIPKGDAYCYRVYIFEGDFNTDRTHNECEIAMDKVDWYECDNGFEGGQYQRGTTTFKNGEEMPVRSKKND